MRMSLQLSNTTQHYFPYGLRCCLLRILEINDENTQKVVKILLIKSLHICIISCPWVFFKTSIGIIRAKQVFLKNWKRCMHMYSLKIHVLFSLSLDHLVLVELKVLIKTLTKVTLKDKNLATLLTINHCTYHFFLSKHNYDQIKAFFLQF